MRHQDFARWIGIGVCFECLMSSGSITLSLMILKAGHWIVGIFDRYSNFKIQFSEGTSQIAKRSYGLFSQLMKHFLNFSTPKKFSRHIIFNSPDLLFETNLEQGGFWELSIDPILSICLVCYLVSPQRNFDYFVCALLNALEIILSPKTTCIHKFFSQELRMKEKAGNRGVRNLCTSFSLHPQCHHNDTFVSVQSHPIQSRCHCY